MPETIIIKKGLDLPILGEPEAVLEPGKPVRSVALLGNDYVGVKPSLSVREGDSVRLGQTLFVDRKRRDIRFTSPGAGVVRAINRGDKRRFLSVVVDLEGDDAEVFESYEGADYAEIPGEEIRENLIRSGLWTSFRTRPYNRIPEREEKPRSIFVTAMDSHPLAMDPALWIGENQMAFDAGLALLTGLTEGKVYVCCDGEASVEVPEHPGVVRQAFAGPHPSGLAGTHIHFLDPASERRVVWFLNYQDVIAMGALFQTGRLPVERAVAIGGPGAVKPRFLRTRLGASLGDLLVGEVRDPETTRVVSGSVLSGRTAAGAEAWLGKFHLQVSLLSEGTRRDFLNWMMPGMNRFSIRKAYGGSLIPGRRRFAFTTSKEGSERAMVPIGMYESVMPLDILPTFLLRALVVGDNAQAQDLGCLELDEDDLALCSFVCPGKTEYGPILRTRLEEIERDG